MPRIKICEIKVGQIYTFNNGQTFDIINNVEPSKIWYQIWQMKDLTAFHKELNRSIIWSRVHPDGGTFIDLEYAELDLFRKWFNKWGKLLGNMNEDFIINENFHLVKNNGKNKIGKLWTPYREPKEVEVNVTVG